MRPKIIYIDVYLPLIASKYKRVGIEGLSEAERVILAMFIPSEQEAKCETLEQDHEQDMSIDIKKTQIEMATELLKDGMTPELVQKYTDLLLSEIENIMITI